MNGLALGLKCHRQYHDEDPSVLIRWLKFNRPAQYAWYIGNKHRVFRKVSAA